MKTIYVLTQKVYFDEQPDVFVLSAGKLKDLETMLETIDTDEIADFMDDNTYLVYCIDTVNQNSSKEKEHIIVASTNLSERKMDWHYDVIDEILKGEFE